VKPFPEIVVVPSLPRKVVARYMERAKPRRIELSLPLGAHDAQMRKLVILHEIGHWFRNEHLPRHEMVGGEEGFAHEFAAYFLSPRSLRTDKPERYRKLHGWLDGERGKILSFARRCYAALAKETGTG
jgi:hypothetical protein